MLVTLDDPKGPELTQTSPLAELHFSDFSVQSISIYSHRPRYTPRYYLLLVCTDSTNQYPQIQIWAFRRLENAQLCEVIV